MECNAWPYVAGILDGEGTIALCFYRQKERPSEYVRLEVRINNTDFRLIKWLMHNFGGRFQAQANDRGFKNTRVLYSWYLSGKANKEKFLLGILPHLQLKREQALIAMEFLKLGAHWDREKKHALAMQCQNLNNRVESPTTNTPNDSNESKIESELHSDVQSAPVVTQDSDIFPAGEIKGQTKVEIHAPLPAHLYIRY